MKIIFSRKGFDAQYGGVASPIFDDDSMVSLPIPLIQGRPLGQVDSARGPLAPLVHTLTSGRLGAGTCVHLDPDLCAASVPRQVGWRPCFGQTAAAQDHLARQGVGVGDVFLFFGWFRRIELHQGAWRYVREAPDIHSLFGWLQVEEVLHLGQGAAHPTWLHDHPHVVFANQLGAANTLYIAAQTLFDGRTPGAGTFGRWRPNLQLTAPGQPMRSRWQLPSWMHPAVNGLALSYHGNLQRWHQADGWAQLQTVAKGQEFVFDVGARPHAHQWLRALLAQDAPE